MKFKANSRRRALEYEKDILKFWKENRIFEKSVENRSADNQFVFYDGPPFLTGSPHHGHLLVSTVKDAIGRFQTMKGKRVERTWGWDCHGLPAEVFVEKELGIKNKKEIGEKISIPDYVAACRAAMVKTSTEWEDTIDRLGRWVEFEGAYKTMDKEYMESVWWAFKMLYDKGKIYEGEKILVYCTKDATPISKSEVAMENSYQMVTDPSVYVKFKIKTGPKSYLMGVDNIDKDLKKLGCEFKKTEDGDYKVTIPENQLDKYEKLVVEKMKPGFWNEYILGSSVHFTFKHENGSIEKYVYDAKTSEGKRQKILELTNKFSGSDDESVECVVYDNDWYKPTYLLAWTTTPWTLPANVALAVSPEMDYVEVEHNGEILIMAKSLVEKVMTDEKHQPLDYKIVGKLKGKDLVGLKYEPLFDGSDDGIPIRKIDFSDDSDYEEFLAATGPWPGYAESIKKLADKGRAISYCAEADGKMVGIATLMLDGWEKDDAIKENFAGLPELNGLQVDERFRGRGIGTKLTLALEKKARELGYTTVGLGVEVKNERAIDLYERLGYKKEKVAGEESFRTHWTEKDSKAEKGYSEYNTDCFLMTKNLLEQEDAIVQSNESVSSERRLSIDKYENAYRVYAADYVSDVDGTGIVHTAPAYGEDDFSLAEQYDLPVKSMVDADGNYTEGRWTGKNIWEVNKEIAKTLLAEGKALKIDYIRHEYPHCHRCGTKLMYRAHPSWFMDIVSQKQEMLKSNENTRWVPDNLRTGRFHNIIEQAPDWNLSRDRYWATPIPVWKGEKSDGTTVVKVIGSYNEFEELTGLRLDDYHLPQVMDVAFEYEGATMHHIGKVLDCWFESGSMPFAQFHYPFENKEKFEESFPADFITEAIDQTRGWFYSLMAVNVGLFGKAPWKNLICTGFMNAADGKKMSKKLKNYTDPMELMDKFSADSFRFLMLSSPLTNGENFSLVDKMVGDVARKLGMIWNMYDFFTMYAEVDGWEFDSKLTDPLKDLTNPLDRWIVSRLHEVVAAVEQALEKYDFQEATKPILPFVDDASNWYVRRSRRRFWKSEDDNDKSDAYKTLHYVLTQLAIVLAPFTPFLSEELYQKMTGGESVHLLDWLPAGEIDKQLLAEMGTVREVVNRGLFVRAQEQIKVRQPLASVVVKTNLATEIQPFADIIEEELNVKKVEIVKSDDELEVDLDLELTPELAREGLAREVIRAVQNARKKAGLNVDDRISLELSTDDKNLQQAVDQFKDEIHRETLTVGESVSANAYDESVQVDKINLTIQLEKA